MKKEIYEEKEINIGESIDKIISDLHEYMKEGFTHISLKIKKEYDDEYILSYVTKIREETDIEYDKRIKYEEKSKEKAVKYLKKEVIKDLRKQANNLGFDLIKK